MSTLKTQGIHHVALTSTNFEASRKFYSEIMKMQVEWEPDADNVYLTNGNDNLAIHRGNPMDSNLDHIGFILNSEEEVDQWYTYLCNKGVQIKKEPRTHRDGARSFYVCDPDGVSVQLIYHPPLSRQTPSSQ
ncbi:MAG: VOC family protein [Gammaproteobacteria bacterium]|nr:VOC family protein [Gammaproteobacteria bacterium]